MNQSRKTDGPRPTTLRILPSEPPTTGPPSEAEPSIVSSPFEFDLLLDGLEAIDPIAADSPRGEVPEVPTPVEPSVPSSPDAPSIPDPSVPTPDEPATPVEPDGPELPIDPVPQPETTIPQPNEVPDVS